MRRKITATFSDGWSFSRSTGHTALKYGWQVRDKASGVRIAAGFTTKNRLPLDAARHINHGITIGQQRDFEIVELVYAELRSRGRPRVRPIDVTSPWRVMYKYDNTPFFQYFKRGRGVARFKTEEEAKTYSDNIMILPGEERKIFKYGKDV